MVRDGEKPQVSFKAYNRIKNILYVSIHSYLNIFLSDDIEKGAMSITSRKNDNCPTPKQRFSDKSPPPLPGLTRWQIPDKSPDGMGMLGIHWAIIIIISSKFFFLFIGLEPTMWPAKNQRQKMVCSCAMLSNCVWFWCLATNNILLIRKRNHAFLLAWKWQIALLPKDIHVDQS